MTVTHLSITFPFVQNTKPTLKSKPCGKARAMYIWKRHVRPAKIQQFMMYPPHRMEESLRPLSMKVKQTIIHAKTRPLNVNSGSASQDILFDISQSNSPECFRSLFLRKCETLTTTYCFSSSQLKTKQYLFS